MAGRPERPPMNFITKFKQTGMARAIGWGMEAPQARHMEPAMEAPVVQAAALPPVPLPKAPKGAQTIPGYRTQIVVGTSALPRTDRLLANSDRLDARTLGDTRKTVRALSRSSPDLSSSVSFLLRTGIPEDFTLVVRDMNGQINVAGTEAGAELLRRMTYLGNVDGSFGAQKGLQSLSEELALEAVLDGAMCLEVALDKARVPASLNPVSIPTLRIYEEENAFKLVQSIGGTEIDLDLPTIIYVAVDQLQSEAYPSSYIESAIQPILADIDFNNDMRRTLKRAVLPRLVGTVDGEAVKKLCPPDILADGEKFIAYKQALIDEIQTVVNGLAPEDAMIMYDSVKFAYVDATNDPSAIIERMQKVLNGKLSSGAKTLPVILGHGGGANAASTESLLYIKQANMLRVKLNELYSRALTIAVRLLGMDCYAEFKYAHIDLRPEAELEAYKLMKQSRLLQLLSLGLMTDEQVCIALTGGLPPAGYKPLAGTMFMQGGAQQSIENPASNTSTMNKTEASTPKAAKSQNGGKTTAQMVQELIVNAATTNMGQE